MGGLTQEELERKFRADLIAARNALAVLEKDAAWVNRDEEKKQTYAAYLPALNAGAKLSRVGNAVETPTGPDNYWATAEDIIGPY
jgi:hypothetical protein